MAATPSVRVTSWFILAVLLVGLTTTYGAPSQNRLADTADDSTILLRRLRRSPAIAPMQEALMDLLDKREFPKQNERLEDQAAQLENLLKEEGSFQPRPNGGSFSPVSQNADGNTGSLLPEFNRIPLLSNNCPTCVPDSFRWGEKN